jgi:hypothetical protein
MEVFRDATLVLSLSKGTGILCVSDVESLITKK